MKTRTSHTTAAFTLAELMTVVAIMALLLSMSVAAYTQILQSKGVEGAKKQITSAIFTARMKAIKIKGDITCALMPVNGEESGFMVRSPYPSTAYVTNRAIRLTDMPNSDDPDDLDVSARKAWGTTKFAGKWAIITGGPGSGYPAQKITFNTVWTLSLEKAWERSPENNSYVAIFADANATSDVPPLPEQYKVTSDIIAGTWEALPKFIHVDGTGFPISFHADGTAGFPEDHAIIRLRDMRTDDDGWTWRIAVERGAGRVLISQILPGDEDFEPTWRK